MIHRTVVLDAQHRAVEADTKTLDGQTRLKQVTLTHL